MGIAKVQGGWETCGMHPNIIVNLYGIELTKIRQAGRTILSEACREYLEKENILLQELQCEE